MTPQTGLELKGNFLTHPFAELVAEISQARLTGSLRVSNKDQKCILYFTNGRLPFAVSNSRSSRLFDILVQRKRLTRDDLTKIPNFSNDFELAAFLRETNFATKAESDQLFIDQIEAIVIDILGWQDGSWNFSSLTRIRDGLVFNVNINKIMLDYGRCLPVDTVLGRFRTLNEAFQRSEVINREVNLRPDEMHILTRFSESEITITHLTALSALPESAAIKSLYALWLGGFLERKDWNPAFSPISIDKILGARLELKREAQQPVVSKPAAVTAEHALPVEAPFEPDVAIALDEYLTRVESAQTHYDVLGLDHTVEQIAIKRTYFTLAKLFHPDHYHKDGRDVVQRVQRAFTQLAKAHETLKNVDIRENYDFKMRKELAERKKSDPGGTQQEANLKVQHATENFDHGFNLLTENQTQAALPFLARAAHFAPTIARYRAYYGKALSIDDSQRHKAEGEIQAAVKLDPTNPNYRIILVQFFIQMNLLKRAEGELNRTLATFPNNREAHELLDSLKS